MKTILTAFLLTFSCCIVYAQTSLQTMRPHHKAFYEKYVLKQQKIQDSLARINLKMPIFKPENYASNMPIMKPDSFYNYKMPVKK